MDEEATSIGEKLWILKNGVPAKDFTAEQRRRIHLENFYRDDEGHYLVASKDGYLLTVTGRGDAIADIRHEIQGYIEDNLYISGMKYRTDIGQRVEEREAEIAGAVRIFKKERSPKPVAVLGY